MAMTMAAFLRLADFDLDEVRLEQERAYEEQYSKLLKVEGLDDLYKIDGKMAGFGSFIEIAEGADVTFDEAITPVTRRYDYVRRGLGYKITEKLWRNDQYGKVRQFEASLKRADMYDTEVFAFGLLNSATATTNATGFDALALASTAHTRLDGGATQANRPTTLVALSHASLQDAIIAYKRLNDDRGRPYISDPKKLVFETTLEPTVEELLGSTLRSDTANNTTNALRRYGLSTHPSRFLTGSTYWALFGDDHDIRILWRYRSETSNETEFESDTIKHKLVKGLGRGFGEWRGYYQGNT